MDQEFEVLCYSVATSAFEVVARVGDGGMEAHRERNACRYAQNSKLTAAQRAAAALAMAADEDRVLVFESRATDDLYLYRLSRADGGNNSCH